MGCRTARKRPYQAGELIAGYRVLSVVRQTIALCFDKPSA
jgi:hypothetical protein